MMWRVHNHNCTKSSKRTVTPHNGWWKDRRARAPFRVFSSSCSAILLYFCSFLEIQKFKTEIPNVVGKLCLLTGNRKKDHLTVSFENFKNSLTAKQARTKYFSEMFTKHCHRPSILFNTINWVINLCGSVGAEASSGTREMFSKFFYW